MRYKIDKTWGLVSFGNRRSYKHSIARTCSTSWRDADPTALRFHFETVGPHAWRVDVRNGVSEGRLDAKQPRCSDLENSGSRSLIRPRLFIHFEVGQRVILSALTVHYGDRNHCDRLMTITISQTQRSQTLP